MSEPVLKISVIAAGLAIGLTSTSFADDIEVLHEWSAEAEVGAANKIKESLATKGYTWIDSAVGGQSGANKRQVLQTRIAAGNPPPSSQFVGYDGLIWWREGLLRDLSVPADAGGWADAVSPQLLPFIQDDGHFFAAPINMHRQNWFWANKKLFDDNGIAVPTSWDEVIAAGDKLSAAGVLPLAIGDESWQIGVVFDAIMADLHGPEFYTKAAIELDPATLSSPEMVEAFDMLRKVSVLAGENYAGRDWSVATSMVINGEAGMQVMGDWAKGEFLAQGLQPDVDFYCFARLGDQVSFLFLVDSFAMFEVGDESVEAAQIALAESIMDPEVQKQFNLIKGSIPARSDVDLSEFDACAQKGAEERAEAIESGSMLGAITHYFASEPQFATVFNDVAGQFFVNPSMTSDEAVAALVQGIDNAR